MDKLLILTQNLNLLEDMFGNINPNRISVPIRVHNLAYKAVKNMRVKNVTVLMDTHKANAGTKRNDIM